MSEFEEESAPIGTDGELRELLGLFDAPAFARRGLELEQLLARLDERCRIARDQRLDMVRLRLKQWAAVASCSETARLVFESAIDHLWTSGGAEPPAWAAVAAPLSRLERAGRELSASVERFNRNWIRFVREMNIEPVNRLVDNYNRYYILEKECVLGSAKLAARLFRPRERLTHDELLDRHPPLPPPRLLKAR